MQRQPLVQLPHALTHPREEPSARYVLGVDGGATKTLAAVLDLQEQTLALGHAGPSNEDAVGADAAVDALLGSAEAAMDAAGIAPEQLGAAVIAVAGTDTEAIARAVRARRESWVVVNDVVGAWAAATGTGPGIAVISGTGSNVFGVGADGRTWRAGGWGHVLGDEGSGYWLGVQSIKAALRDREASGPATALSDALPRFFSAPSVEALASRVYSKPMTKGEIASFAAELARVAAAGDEVARDLYVQGARELAQQVAAVIRMTSLSGAFPVGLIGSVYRVGEMFVGPLTDTVREHAPHARVQVVEVPPVGGSLLLAARVCGRERELPAGELASAIEGALERRPR